MHRLCPLLVAWGVACIVTPVDSQACNVPVFRYALERWPADPYQILVYHRAEPRGAAFDLLRKSAPAKGVAANYSLQSVDAATPEGDVLAQQHRVASFPWVEIYYPLHSQVRTPVWSGPLTLDRARTILDSPRRSRLARQLLSGEVAVWVLIDSGRQEKDRRAREALKTNLERASATLRIPEAGTDVNGNPIQVSDFKNYPVRFGLMEIARDEPGEDLLVSALLQSEPDLARYDEPMAFPVFGQGRALYALVGDGIAEKNIREACEAMVAWCSCEVKAASPGTDLLMSADWSRTSGGRMVNDPELPFTGLSNFLPQAEAVKTAPPQRAAERVGPPALCRITPPARGAGAAAAGAPQPRPTGASPLVRNALALAAAAGVFVLAFSVFLTVKAKR